MSQAYRAPVVRKAFSVLELLSGREPSLSLSDLARGVGLGKSTVLGIVAALEESGAVVRDPVTKRYSLGLRLLELGRAVDARLDLKRDARPILETLAARTGQTVFLGIRANDHVTILDSVESTADLKITAPVGTRLPLLAGATGKVLLAALPEAEVRAVLERLGFRSYTERTIVDVDRYLGALAAVRRRGWALDDEEYIPGVRAVAARIPDGNREAAVWIVGLSPALDGGRLAALGRETLDAAARIAKAAGVPGPRPTPVGTG